LASEGGEETLLQHLLRGMVLMERGCFAAFYDVFEIHYTTLR
jgi:hypothetical protein